jgi:glycine dehydrogenase subunit 2
MNQSCITRGLLHYEPLLFEQGAPGRSGASLPELDVPETDPQQALGEELLRSRPADLPEVSEVEVARHFTRLSHWNHAIDLGMYPLGSCTMKYNPKVNEVTARLPGFAGLHPYQPHSQIQGALQLLWELERSLAVISGFSRITLQPAAGAHGELTGLLLIRAYHEAQGDPRQKIIIPDTAHGTNPASVALNGYKPVGVKTGSAGVLRPEDVEPLLDDQVAGIMVTNPNTLGVYETHLREIADRVHAVGGLVYMDGANLNAILGKVRPGQNGVDVMHFNLHKTFSTPHGGGGPGAGPVGVVPRLEPFLPVPTVEREGEEEDARYRFDYDRPQSIGRVRSFYGNFAVLVRAFTFIRELGGPGLTRAAEMAVLNANYIRARLKDLWPPSHQVDTLHETVFNGKAFKRETGVSTMDVAKRLMDHGFHPPTVYFPLIVPEALMIEPTESEPPAELDRFCDAMWHIHQEARTSSDMARQAPHQTGPRRLDETRAARKPKLRWTRPADDE